MLTTVEGVYKQGKVALAETPEGVPDEGCVLDTQ